MDYVQPYVEFIDIAPIAENAMLSMIEIAGRTCYKSEDKITEGSNKVFFKMITRRGHGSVNEHSNICIKLPLSEISNNNKPCFFSFKNSFIQLLHKTKKSNYFEFDFFDENKTYYIASSIRGWFEFFLKAYSKKLDLNREYGEIINILFQFMLTKYPFIFGEIIYDIVKKDERVKDINFNNYDCGMFELVDIGEQFKVLIDSEYQINLPVFIFKVLTCRSITHEVVRNRTLHFSQESTRYVDYYKKVGMRIWDDSSKFKENEVYNAEEINKAKNMILSLYKNIEDLYNYLVQEKDDKKLLPPEIARNILPNSLMAEIVISGRLGADIEYCGIDLSSQLTHFIRQRGSAAAHPDIRPIAKHMYETIDNIINTFIDAPYKK